MKTCVKLLISTTLLAGIVLGFVLWMKEDQWIWTNDAYIEAYNVQISADLEARIIKLYVDEGDYVKKGDPLIDLQRDILEAEKLEAETKVALLEEEVKHNKVYMEKLRDKYVVARREFDSDIISFIDFDHYEKDFRMAELQYTIAKKALDQGFANLGVIHSKLDHTRIYAPRNGVIAKRWVLPGHVASLGQPLFELNELDNVWITANLEETKLKEVKKGAKVKIHIDAYPDLEFTGKVWVVKASAASKFALIPPENATGNFTKVVQRVPVKIHIELPKTKPTLYLFPGMSCEVKIRK